MFNPIALIRSVFVKPKPVSGPDAEAKSEPVPAPPVFEWRMPIQKDIVEIPIEDGKLVFGEPTNLTEHFRQKHLKRQGSDLLRAMKHAESLKSADQRKSDYDRREGHVVLPNANFESHGAEFRKADHIVVEGDDKTVRAVFFSANKFLLPNQKARFPTEAESQKLNWSTWNKETSSLRLDNTDWKLEEPCKTDNPSMKGAVTFSISTDGSIALPGVSSLDKVDSIENERKTALRAQEILDTALSLEKAAEGYDNTNRDKNSQDGIVIVPDLQKYAPGFLDGPLVESKYWFGGGPGACKRTSKSFALQAKEGEVQAVGLGYGYERRAPSLTSKKSDKGRKIVLEEPINGNREALEWNFATGELAYKKS